MVVDGSQWVQPGVGCAAQADRGLDQPDLRGIGAERAHAAALRAPLAFQHPAYSTRPVGRLGVGNGQSPWMNAVRSRWRVSASTINAE